MTKNNSDTDQKAKQASTSDNSSNSPKVQSKVQKPMLDKVKASKGKASPSKIKKTSISAKEKSRSWYYNRYQIVAVQRNILLIFSIFAMIAVAVCVVFVKSITASKSLEPYVIEIEEKTGIPVVVDQQTITNYSSNQMVIRYFLNQFVHAASGFDARTYKLDALKVRLMSTSAVNADFKRRVRPKDLSNKYIKVRIKSIQFPGKDVAQIRILRVVSTDTETKSYNEVINVDYRFSDLSLNSEERMINPLGFQVGRYLITEEVYDY